MPRLIKVTDYNHAKELLRRCRKPTEGKQIASWCRIYDSLGEISFVTDGGTEIGRLTHDNMFTFTLSWSAAVNVSPTLTRGLYKISDLLWFRDAKAKYIISHRKQAPTRSDLFTGLQMHWGTGVFTNPRLLDTTKVDSDARRYWLQCLRDYKKGLKVRAKMGVFDTIIRNVLQERSAQTRYNWTQPDWFSPLWIDKLVGALKNQDFSLDLMKALVQTSEIGYWNRKLSTTDVLASFDKLTRDLSVQLRLRFGVFGECNEMHQVQEKDEVCGHQRAG